MKLNKIVSAIFALAGCCFIAGTVNHLLNTGEGVLSSLLLALGCFCGAFTFYKKKP